MISVMTSNEKESNKPSFEKRFKLKHFFEDVISLKENHGMRSDEEDHFNVNWCIRMLRFKDHIGFFVHCEPIAFADKWSIQTELRIKIGKKRKNFFKKLTFCYGKSSAFLESHADLEWEKMGKEYLVNGNLTVEAKVTIIETTGLGKEKIRKFDESQKDVSDVIIVVRSTKFYVSRMYLASQSSFFKSLFIENRSVSNKLEIALPGLDPSDFQYFLEVLYGEYALDDSNVEEVLLLADRFDSPTVRRRCEDFLLNESKKAFITKSQIASRYHLENLYYTRAIANANSKTKQFTLKYSFKDVNSFEDWLAYNSEEEDHFNLNWCIVVERQNNCLGFYVLCEAIVPTDRLTILTKLELKVVGRNQNDFIRTEEYRYIETTIRGFPESIEWERIEKEYLVNGNLQVEVKVTIFETSGEGKEKIREFDGKDEFDCNLLVIWNHFRVMKTYLADRSLFFKAIFFGKFSELKSYEVRRLSDVDPYDFHYFLEVLYGESAIDDSTIEGILMLAGKYDAPMVVEKCQEFLLNSSKKSPKKKLELSFEYNLEELKKNCVSEPETVAPGNDHKSYHFFGKYILRR